MLVISVLTRARYRHCPLVRRSPVLAAVELARCFGARECTKSTALTFRAAQDPAAGVFLAPGSPELGTPGGAGTVFVAETDFFQVS
jgi:hypothetical protein